jgi:hypothetical protein
MAKRSPARKRAKVSVTVDPGLLNAVDSYIQRHAGMNRSKVMDSALTSWYAVGQQEAMVEQFTSREPTEVQAEREAWKRIRRGAATRMLKRTGR